MAIAAKVSPVELTNQVADRFVDTYFEARLINAPGTAYLPGTTVDADFLAFEPTVGVNGYNRQVISYATADVSLYADDGVGLSTRATIFAHDGVSPAIEFSHVALVWSNGNITSFGSTTTKPTAGVDGTYTNIPVDSTSGTGVGATVDLTVSNGGAQLNDFVLTINKPGYGYAATDTVTINDATLATFNVITAGAGDLIVPISSVYSPTNAGDLLAVAQTSGTVSLSGGNEAAFYWNYKQFGYYAT